MGWRRGVAASREVVEERVADFDRDPRLVGSLRRRDLQDIDGAELVAQDRPAGGGLLPIERLETTARERRNSQGGNGPKQAPLRWGAWRARAVAFPPAACGP